MQAEIAREVAATLRLDYLPAAEYNRAALRLVNPSAYDKYLQAREAMASHDASRRCSSSRRPRPKIPSLIEAQAGLAEALYMMSAFEGREQFGSVRARARQAAEAAFATDPDLAATRLAMGLTASTSREALEQLRRAVEIDASFPDACLALAGVLRPIDPARAAAFARRAAELDPAQPLVYFQLAAAELAAGDLDGTLAAMDQGRALAPAQPWWDAIRDRVRLARATAREPGPHVETRAAGDFPPGIVLRAAVLAVSGRINDAAALAGTLVRRHPGSCEARAMLAAALVRSSRPMDGVRAAAGCGQQGGGCRPMEAAGQDAPRWRRPP